MALPGSVYIYQGEELGLGEVQDIPDELRQDPIWARTGGADPGRDGSRVPLPWSGTEPPFGFSPAGAAAQPWLPQPKEWRDLTVAAESANPDSVLALYRAALRIRRAEAAFGHGPMSWQPAPDGVLAFDRGRPARPGQAERATAQRCAASPTCRTARCRCRRRPRCCSPAARSTAACCRPTPPPGSASNPPGGAAAGGGRPPPGQARPPPGRRLAAARSGQRGLFGDGRLRWHLGRFLVGDQERERVVFPGHGHVLVRGQPAVEQHA